MAKARKKHPKIPNGYGSIKYLGENRRNPYAVHPPTVKFNKNGSPITPKALCYVDNWYKGFAILTAYKAGTYTPGMEAGIALNSATNTSIEGIVAQILADYNRTKHDERKNEKRLTFAEVYDRYYKYKFERENAKTYSDSSRSAKRSAFKNCSKLHHKVFSNVTHEDLQRVIDECSLKHASKELICSLFTQMYRYALANDITNKNYAINLEINTPDDDEHGVPFSENELKTLWDNKDNKTIELILIMVYSGYRISAYKVLEVNLKGRYFKGGVKTKSGKERVVPIHSSILDIVKKRYKRDSSLLCISTTAFRNAMYSALEELNITRHTPHDCRHTFSMLCEKYEVKESDRKRMLGHSLKNDITNGIYGHRTLEELRAEIEKIQICY